MDKKQTGCEKKQTTMNKMWKNLDKIKIKVAKMKKGQKMDKMKTKFRQKV